MNVLDLDCDAVIGIGTAGEQPVIDVTAEMEWPRAGLQARHPAGSV